MALTKEDKQKITAGVVTSAGAGFALGWLLHRPKKTGGPSLQLSNLTIDPMFDNQVVVVGVDVTNVGNAPASGKAVAQTGNNVQESQVSLGPGEWTRLSWDQPMLDLGFGDIEVTVSIDPLRGSFSMPSPM